VEHALKPGDSLGPYKIVELVGAGGMGQVYRATDAKLNRDVALKILPDAFASDPDRLARFRREAQVLASLSHPNIGHIYGLEDSGARHALVLELIEGPTLAELIAPRERRSSPSIEIADTLRIALQIAAALEAAHEQGVVHRDLKPANVKVRPDGLVKVLDFGLAKALDPSAPSATAGEAMESPTVTGPPGMTDAGEILGTAPYMSPEQARGKFVDKRADIWAFGCVLFEMLAGRRAFEGETNSDTMAAILTREPEWTALPAATPAKLRGLLQRCLEKDPTRRLRDIGEARIEIEHLIGASTNTGTAARHRGRQARWAVAIAALVLLLAGAYAVYSITRPRALGALQFTQITDFADTATAASLSPDGRMVTFIRGGPYFLSPRQVGQIYVKQLPNGEPVRLTNDPRPKFAPVFTPDGARVAYSVVDGESWDTWTVPVFGGQPTRMLPNASGLSWMPDGRVLFSEIKSGFALHMGIVTATEVRADSREIYFPEHERAMAHYSYASPDRKWILIVEMGPGGGFTQPCRVVPFDGSSKGRSVGPEGACRSAAWSPDGQWMYFGAQVDARSHLWRQRFPDGAPEQITFDPTEEEGIAVAPDGNSLVTSVGEQRSAIWIHDEAGDRQITSEGFARLPQLSRDGRDVFYLQGGNLQGSELRRIDLASGNSESVLPGWSMGFYDVSPDESQVAFTNRRDGGQLTIWLASLDRRSPPREITRGGDQVSFGPNGALIFRQQDKNANYLYRINRDGSGRERILSTPILNKAGASPDGEWVIVNRALTEADAAQASGGARAETVAVPLRGGTPRRICAFNCLPGSTWSPDGRFLYIAAGQGRTTVLPVPPGQSLPDLPASGISSPDAALSMPGARAIEQAAIPGANPSVYVFLKTELRRNLFRIHLR
jgi:Tol biopolymer transport system component